MANNISDNLFENFCVLSQNVQKIENQIKNDQITSDKRIELHKQLESLQGSIEAFRQRATLVQKQTKQFFSQFTQMEKQVVSLYRKIEEGFENFEMTVITKEAFDLTRSLKNGKMLETAKKVHALRHNVLFLFKHRCPSLQNRKIIHLALKLSDHIDEILQTKIPVTKQNLQFIQFLKMLLKEAVLRADSLEDPNEAELAMELYEIAELFYHKKENEGRLKLKLIYSQLSNAQKNRLEESLDNPEALVQILLEIADGDPCLGWEDKKATIYELHA